MRWKPGRGRSANIEDRRGSSRGRTRRPRRPRGLIPGGGKGGGLIGIVVLVAFVFLGKSCLTAGVAVIRPPAASTSRTSTTSSGSSPPAGGAAAGRGPARSGRGPRRRHRRLRVLRPRRRAGLLGRALRRRRRELPGGRARALPGRRPVGLRPRLLGDRALLLPGRLEGLRRPRLLPRADATASAPPATSPRPTCWPTSWATTSRTSWASTPRSSACSRTSRTGPTSCPCALSSRPTASPASGPTPPSSATCSATATSRRASTAAGAVGDDRLGAGLPRELHPRQQRPTGPLAERGYQTGNLEACDTFSLDEDGAVALDDRHRGNHGGGGTGCRSSGAPQPFWRHLVTLGVTN